MRDEVSQALEKTTQLQTTLESEKMMNAQLQADLKSSKLEMSLMKDHLAKESALISEERLNLVKHINRVNDELREMRDEYDRAHTSLEKREAALEGRDGSVDAEAYEREIRSLRQQLDARMPDASVDIEVYENEIHSLKQQLETGLHEVCSLQDQLKDAKAALKKAMKEKGDLEKANENPMKVNQCQDVVDALKADLEITKKDLLKANEELKQKVGLIANLEEDLNKSRLYGDSLQSVAKEYQEYVAELQVRLSAPCADCGKAPVLQDEESAMQQDHMIQVQPCAC